MAENSKIEWCDHTFNPWSGCWKVSEGCKNCYAERLEDKRFGRAIWGASGTRTGRSEAYWEQPHKWNRKAEKDGVRYRVFCASLCDIFEDPGSHIEMAEWQLRAFKLMTQTPYLDWLLLTKRPQNILEFVPMDWFDKEYDPNAAWPVNVWVGTSVENQARADERIPELLTVPAPIHFLSCEPLLGPIDLELRGRNYGIVYETWSQLIDWVIVGGESGPNARPMHPDWARGIRDQCQKAGVPFFFKQWGEWFPWIPRCGCDGLPIKHVMKNGTEYKPGNYSSSLQSMIRLGKRNAGRLLDGKEHNAFPKVVR